MLGLLSAVKTETIIGIVAIVVIVISVGIIVATAIRNYLLQKKMKETSMDENVVVIDVDAQNVINGEIGDGLDTHAHATITEEDEKEALQTDGIEAEFGDEAPDEEEILQEINLEDTTIDENGKIADDVMTDAKVDDNSMAELIKKMSGDNV